MQNKTTYILIETMVKLGIRRIREDPERTIRNMVDMAQNFSGGRFQKYFFELAQVCLEKEDSPYYSLITDVVQHTESDTLRKFGMNLGYNGCTAGAKTIRELEKAHGHNIPWAVFLQLPDTFPRHWMDCYQRAISRGEDMGIHTWMLFAQGHPHSALSFVQAHPDSAFCLFCDPGDITLTFLDCAGELKNLMLVLKLDADTQTACKLLRAAGLLYNVFVPYSEENAENILDGSVFTKAKQLHCAFTVLLPEVSCPEAIRKEVYQMVLEKRNAQNFLSIPFELLGDCMLIDSIISDDTCVAVFDKQGNLISVPGKPQNPKCNLLANDLNSIFHTAFPKKQERS